MALVVPNEAERNMLRRILDEGGIVVDALMLKLYTNDVTPDEDTTLASLTEATGFGYAPQVLEEASAEDWTIATASDGTTEAEYTEVVFTFTGALGNVYGYYLTNSASAEDELYWVERFSDGPYNIQNNGDQIKVTCKIQLA